MDDALVQDDGINLIVEELDRCWEVTQDQDRASKIGKALFETQRSVKVETTFMSYVARRKLNFQQLEDALGTPLPAVIKGYATLRDAKLAERSYDKVVMWTGGTYDYDDVVRALVRWTKRQDHTNVFYWSGIGCTDSRFRIRDLDTTKYGPPTLSFRCTARGRRLLRGRRDDNRTRWSDRHPGSFFLLYRRWPREVEENEVPQILLHARPAFQQYVHDVRVYYLDRLWFVLCHSAFHP